MSTGLDCYFSEVKPDVWYYFLEQYESRDEYDEYGPFDSFNLAYDHLHANHANPGGYGIERYKDD